MTEMRPLVPVDEGILRASGHVQPPVIEGLKCVVKLGFGGPAGAGGASHAQGVGYAVFVHENQRVFGTKPGGGSRADADNPRRFRRFRGGRRARTFVGQSGYMKVVMDRRKSGFASRFAKRMVARLRGVGSL